MNYAIYNIETGFIVGWAGPEQDVNLFMNNWTNQPIDRIIVQSIPPRKDLFNWKVDLDTKTLIRT